MRKIKNILKSSSLQQISAILAIILGLPTLVGWFLNLFNLSQTIPFSFITDNLGTLFNLSIFFVIMYLLLSNWRVVRRFNVSFIENFKSDLHENWEFQGDWSKVEKKTLCVKNSEIGGITKIGSLWENYDFEFETKIVNSCSSWIVRAKDLNNYIMFQCRKDVIRPHLRITVPSIEKNSSTSKSNDKNGIAVVNKVGWHIWEGVSHNSNVEDWTKVKIRVEGSGAKIWINEELVYHESNFIPFSTGRVGFRNHGAEEAHFRKVKVKPLN